VQEKAPIDKNNSQTKMHCAPCEVALGPAGNLHFVDLEARGSTPVAGFDEPGRVTGNSLARFGVVSLNK
jgi:hypothetical protein